MKVLQLFNSFDIGGAEVLTYDLLKNYNSLNNTYDLLVSKGGKLEKLLRNEGFESVIKIPRDKLKIGFIIKLRHIIKGNCYHIIHVHSPLDVLYTKLATIKSHTKVVYTVHSFYSKKGIMSAFLKRAAMNLSDYVLFVSKEVEKNYGKNLSVKKPSAVLYNGIDETKFSIKSDSIRQELKLSDDNILGGMIGNFNDVRDQITVCKALALVIEKNPNFHFVFVGSAQGHSYQDECISYCKSKELLDNIHFMGKRTDISSILFSLDLFIYSSNKDTFGIAVVEAMISATPVIVNDIPVFKEITKNGTCSQLYITKFVDDLAEKIEYFIHSPEDRKKLGEKGKKWALEKFTIAKHIEDLHCIYKEVLEF